jgi:hypothetical protein
VTAAARGRPGSSRLRQGPTRPSPRRPPWWSPTASRRTRGDRPRLPWPTVAGARWSTCRCRPDHSRRSPRPHSRRLCGPMPRRRRRRARHRGRTRRRARHRRHCGAGSWSGTWRSTRHRGTPPATPMHPSARPYPTARGHVIRQVGGPGQWGPGQWGARSVGGPVSGGRGAPRGRRCRWPPRGHG